MQYCSCIRMKSCQRENTDGPQGTWNKSEKTNEIWSLLHVETKKITEKRWKNRKIRCGRRGRVHTHPHFSGFRSWALVVLSERGGDWEQRRPLEHEGETQEFRCAAKVSSALDVRLGQGGSWINETEAPRRVWAWVKNISWESPWQALWSPRLGLSNAISERNFSGSSQVPLPSFSRSQGGKNKN